MAVIFCYQCSDGVDSAGAIRVELGFKAKILLVRGHILVVRVGHDDGGGSVPRE